MVIAAVGATAAAVSAAASVATDLSGSKSQSGAVSSGQAQANAAQEQALDQYDSNAQPFISTGTNALSAAGDAAGLNGSAGYTNALSSFDASPSYQYQLSQGLSAVDNGAASTGTLRSGNTIRAEETLGENLANTDFTNYYNRLAGLAGSGLTATNALGSAEINTGAGVASTDTSAATGQSGIAGNEAKGIAGAVTGLAGNSSVQKVATNALSSLGGSSAPENATLSV